MLKKRISTGIIILIMTVGIIYFSHIKWFLSGVIALLSLTSVLELYRACNLKKNKLLCIVTCVFAVLFSFINMPGMEYLTVALFVGTSVLFFFLMKQVKKKKELKPWMTVMVAVAIVCFYKTMYSIRMMNGGFYYLIFAIAISMITDVMAFCVGKCIGKHKLAPVISPKKTIEGSVGGMILAVMICMTAAYVLQRNGLIEVHYGVLFGYLVLASLIGQFGDLAFSAVKRIVGVKDYGTVLPGHGGVLDRMDSLITVLPFTWLFCMCKVPVIVI